MMTPITAPECAVTTNGRGPTAQDPATTRPGAALPKTPSRWSRHRDTAPPTTDPVSRLPDQSPIQEQIHSPHWDERAIIIETLLRSPYPADRKRAFSLAACCAQARVVANADWTDSRHLVSRCRNRLCPLCSLARARDVAADILVQIQAMADPRHLVLTVASSDAPLADQLAALRTHFSRFRRTPEWRRHVVGAVYTIEITRNAQTGQWHPHVHACIDGHYWPWRSIRDAWHRITGSSKVVWITTVTNRAAMAGELAKYIAKTPRITAWPTHAILQYAHATARCRLVASCGSAFSTLRRDRPSPFDPAEWPHSFGFARLLRHARHGSPQALRALQLLAVLAPTLGEVFRHALPQAELPTDRISRTAAALQTIADGPHAAPDTAATAATAAETRADLAAALRDYAAYLDSAAAFAADTHPRDPL